MSRWSHDVFLSFRGEDTRQNFTDHLYAALFQAEVRTFRDDKQLVKGKHISSELLKAIQESKISIVIFSEGYAFSPWCLDELVKIIECRNSIGQIVLPIFYNVDPSNVRNQTSYFADAFDKHKQFVEQEKVNEWREALTEAANLSGWDIQNVANGNELKFIRKIVKDVVSKLNRTYLNVAKYPIGIDSRTKDVILLLNVGANDVRIVGIHGMGGIGKTTLAKAVFNKLCDGFEGSCFLSNIKGLSGQSNGLVQLQEQLLLAVLKQKSLKIGNVDRGISLIKERLSHKRLLVVLDDLDQIEQLDALVGERNWFGLGSRIIITSRNEHLLTQLEVDRKYQVEELNRDESLQLFSWHAFKETQPEQDYMELSNGVVDYVGGLPLALEVLGSYFCKRSMPEWTNALEKLRKIPHHQIQRKLRISFDTLDDDKVKDIFLDIACFFVGTDKEYVATILDGCGFFPEIGINVLIQRSLLTINLENKLSMHDLIRDMGREIVREISPNHPGKRSRVWLNDDVLDILSRKRGTEALEGLVLDQQASIKLFFSTESFAKMRYLRLLQINKVLLTGSFECLSTELRWLCWHNFPLKFLPHNFELDNLVVLDMRYSNIKEVWKGIKVLNKLQILNLSYSLSLSKTPNFLGLNKLERLELEGCKNLVEIHQSIGHLERLVSLNLEGCESLKNLPESICCLKSLETLNVSFCSKLEELPEHLGDMESLTELLAYGASIKLLPFSIGELKNLKNVTLGGFIDNAPSSNSWFSSFASWFSPRIPNHNSLVLPASFACLSSLQSLELRGCNLIEDSIPSLSNLNLLKHLDLGSNSFFGLPTSVGSLTNLEILNLRFCKNLVSISDLPPNLKALIAYKCISLERVSIHSKNSPCLISLTGCPKLVEIDGLENVENKPMIGMENCDSLANDFKEKVWQVKSSMYKQSFSFFLPSIGVPYWFSYLVEGSSLSLYIPLVLDGVEIQGLFICVVYYGLRCAASPFVRIRNKSNGLEYINRYSHSSTFVSFSLVHKDNCWVSYVPFFLLPCAKKGGEELEISVIAVDFEVKKCGVHLIANVEKMIKIVSVRAKRGYDNDNDESAESSSVSHLSSKERCFKRSRKEG